MPEFTGAYKKSGSRSSGGGKFTGSFKKSSSKKKRGNKWWNAPQKFVDKVVGDVAEITYGAVPGLINQGKAIGEDIRDIPAQVGAATPRRGGVSTETKEPFERTREIAKQVGKSYAEMYGPLVKGDWKTFLNNVYEDPVYFTLDALTLASLGIHAPVKAGLIPKRGGMVLELETPSGKVITKPLARGELRAQLQAARSKSLNKQRVVKGQVVREKGQVAAKVAKQHLDRQYHNQAAKALPFEREIRRVRNNDQRIALVLRKQFDRQALNEYMAMLKASDEPTAKSTLKIISKPKVQAFFDAPTKQMEKASKAGTKLTEDVAEVAKLDPDAAEARAFLPARIAEGAKFEEGAITGGPSIADLKARGLNPSFVPHTSRVKRVGFQHAPQGGLGPAMKPGSLRQNQGKLLSSGQMILDPTVILESSGDVFKFAHKNKVHQTLIDDFATPVDTLPNSNWQYVRKTRGERIPYRDRTGADFDEWARANLDDQGEMQHSGDWFQGEKSGDMFTNDPELAATTPDGKRLAVPKSVASKLAGEFTRQSRLMYLINRYPMRIWRYLVLGTVPRYFVNNALGNTLLYIMHSGKPADIKALGYAIREFAKPSEHKAFDALMEKHVAGQLSSGFVATQFPRYRGQNRATRAGLGIINFIPQMDKRWERALRKAKTKTELKRHPELKPIAKRMGTENAYFDELNKVFDANPDHPALTQVYDRVNDALGNYETMTAFEKGAVRTIFPFWAWYRAITGVTMKMAVEQPLKTALIARLAQIAVAENLEKAGLDKDEVPSSLFGFIPGKKDPDGRIRGINTAPFGPHGTVGQLTEFFAALVAGEPGEAGRKVPGINPILEEIQGRLTGKDFGGYTMDEAPGIGTLEGVPISRLLSGFEATFGIDIPGIKPAPEGDTFNDRDFWDELLRTLGVPYARVSPTAAKRVTGR